MGRKEAHKCIYLFDYNIVLALIKHTCILASAIIHSSSHCAGAGMELVK